jgi:hypothetical protein
MLLARSKSSAADVSGSFSSSGGNRALDNAAKTWILVRIEVRIRSIVTGDEAFLWSIRRSRKRMQPAEIGIAFQSLAKNSPREISRNCYADLPFADGKQRSQD